MAETPQVSVVMSTYNRSDTGLPQEALASAFGQLDVDLEVVVANNGSTDDTPAMLAAIDEDRLRVVTNPTSRGPTGGRQSALAHARGEWVSFLDDDDVWAPDKLRAQLDAAAATGSSWVSTGCVFIDGRRQVIGGRPPPTPAELMEWLPVRFVVPAAFSSMLWRRDALDGDGGLDERLVLTADWDLAVRLSRQKPPGAVRRPMVGYRQHGGNESRKAGDLSPELDVFEAKHPDLRAGRPIDRGRQHRFVASELLRVGNRRGAAVAYARAAMAGDWGALIRAPALVAPLGLQPALRRRFLSDGAWMEQARAWLEG